MKKALGVTVAILLGMGVVAVSAQAYLVGGDSCPSCAGSVYELTLAPFGARAYQAFLSTDRYGFSSPGAFLHIGAGTFTDTMDRAAAMLTDSLGGPGRMGEAHSSTTPCGPGGGSGALCGHADVPFVPTGLDPAHGGYPWAANVFPPIGFPLHPGLIHAQPGAMPTAPVPEPSTLLLLGSGLAGLGAVVWRRKSRG